MQMVTRFWTLLTYNELLISTNNCNCLDARLQDQIVEPQWWIEPVLIQVFLYSVFFTSLLNIIFHVRNPKKNIFFKTKKVH